MNKFLDKAPLLPIALASILGIIAAYIQIDYKYIIAILIPISITLYCLIRRHQNIEIRRQLTISIISTLIFSFSYINTNRNLPTEFDYSTATTTTIKIEKIKHSYYTSTILAKVISITDTLEQTTPVKDQHILVYIYDIDYYKMQIGDILKIPAKIKPITNRNNPYEFDYIRYMYNNQIIYSTYITADQIQLIGNNNSIYSISQKIRKNLINRITKSKLSTQSQQFLRGVILGEQNKYSNTIRNKFEATGLAHVLAVSGLHVGIIFIIINILLKCFRIIRTHRYAIIISILIFYCFFTEGSPSVIRATIMLSIYQIYRIKGRQSITLNNTCLAAIIILLFQPLELYNIGFQLSFLSVISITLFMRTINPFHQYQPILFYIGNIFAISIAATIGTLAVTTYYFNHIPTAFLIANITIVPLLPFIFTLGITSFILPQNQFICNLFDLIYEYIIKYLSWIESIPYLSPIKDINIGITEIIIYTLSTILLAIYIQNKKNKLFPIISILLIITTIAIAYQRNNSDSGENLYIMNDHNTLTIFYHKNHNGYLIFSDEKKLDKFKYNYPKLIVNKNIKEIEIITDRFTNQDISVNYPYIHLHDIHLAIINAQPQNIFIENAPLETVNYLVIGDGYYGTLKPLTKYLHTDSVILTSTMNNQFGGRIIRETRKDSIPTHYTKTEGAWIYHIK